jgi:hypothetical protein
MTLDFGHGPDRLKRWATYVLNDPDRWGSDAVRVAQALSTAPDNVERLEARQRKKLDREETLL